MKQRFLDFLGKVFEWLGQDKVQQVCVLYLQNSAGLSLWLVTEFEI